MAREEEIAFFPFATGKLSLPTVPETPVPVVPVDEIRVLLATCKPRTFVNLRDEALIRLFFDTGARVPEMAGLLKEPGDDVQVPHVDLEQLMVWVMGKGRRFGVSRSGAKTGLALDRYMRERWKHPLAWRPELWLGEKMRGPLRDSGMEQMLWRRTPQLRVLPIPQSQSPRPAWLPRCAVKTAKVAAPGPVAEILGIPSGRRALRRTETLGSDGQPTGFTVAWYPPAVADAAPRLADAQPLPAGSLAYIAEVTGIRLRQVSELCSAEAADQDVANTLGVTPGSPVLAVRARLYDADGNLVEYAETFISATSRAHAGRHLRIPRAQEPLPLRVIPVSAAPLGGIAFRHESSRA